MAGDSALDDRWLSRLAGSRAEPPAVVRHATDDYLSAEDAFTLWMEDCTAPDPNAWEPTRALFSSWKRWADAAQEFVGSQKRFAQTLEERGFMAKRQGGTGIRGYLGSRLKDATEPVRWEP